MNVVLRVTARHFQRRFQQLTAPTLVNQGIFFPVATKELIKIAEQDIAKAAKQGREG